MHTIKRLITCVGLAVVGSSIADTNFSQVPDAVLDTIAQINHMNWVVTKIKNYNNALVLEEEYDKISPGMLNLNRIPDKETLDRIIALLDELYAMRKSEREIKFWRDHFDMERKQRQIDFWKIRFSELHPGKASIGEMWSRLISPTAILELARSVASTTLDEYSAYSKFVGDLEKEVDKKIFDFDSAKLAAIHRRNKEMLQDQWQLIRKYNLDDSLRVAEADLLALIEILKDPDPAHIYPRIEPLRSRFPTFPVYWYYLSTAALEAKEYKTGLEACDTFFKVNRGLFRDDPMAGIVALNKAVMLEKTEANKAEIRHCLDECRKQTALKPDWRRDYVCASLYAGFLCDQKTAILILKRAMATLENRVKNDIDTLRKIASSENVAIRYGEADFPDGDALVQCLRLYREIESGTGLSLEGHDFSKLGVLELTSPVERLEFIGHKNVEQIWKAVGKDLEKVSLKYDTAVRKTGKVSWRLDSEMVARFPVRWFLSGGFDVEIGLMDGVKRVATLSESRKLRSAASDDYIELRFPVDKNKLSAIDSFVLEFKHPRYPFLMVFASRTPYLDKECARTIGDLSLAGKFSADKLCDDLALYEISICGKMFRRDKHKSDGESFSKNVDENDWRLEFAEVFRNLMVARKGRCKTNVAYISYVDLKDDGVTIHYENSSDHAIKPKVSIYLLSKYGCVIGRMDDVWRFKKLEAGVNESKSFKFINMDKVAYIDVVAGE